MVDSEKLPSDGWEVVRQATERDFETLRENERLEQEAFDVCQRLIRERDLPMKLVRVEYTFDRCQSMFYFTAETRVDFRELVRDLAHQFRTRIELKQVGVRDEAKILGGIGYCGRELCCKSFLRNFQPVSKKMARDQNLTLNPSKISGICGRLLCCLVYEQATYEDLRRDMPGEGTNVETPSGPGKIRTINPLKGTIDVQLEAGVSKAFDCSEVEVVKAGNAKERQKAPAKGQQKEATQESEALVDELEELEELQEETFDPERQ
ncbi:MAG: hypothetical protein JW941_08325 [Candidatus Coatesbacteria bacterium]|nr:hypothetical protein [Candidatus Coatesbacteria bacterium]